MCVRIVIDSTADITEAVRKECTVVPLTVHFGDAEFTDGVTISPREFYQRLISSDTLPTTSQPTPAAFAAVYEEAVSAGDEVVVITISSNLSGTYQSACIASMDYPGKVFVVDSLSAALGTGILAELAVSLKNSGMTASQIARHLTEQRDNIVLIATVDTLEYLKKGGRIPKTVAFAGELLSIKPVIAVKDGQIVVLGKARGNKQSFAALNKQIDAHGGVDFSKPALLGYTGLDDTLLQQYKRESTHIWSGDDSSVHNTIVGSVIGTHAGPGAVAVAFFARKQKSS